MDLLAYWRWDIYRHDLDHGAGFHFNSRQYRLHSSLSLGERLWLVSGRPAEGGTTYLIVACLNIAAKTENREGYAYGKYRVWADFNKSRYFATKDGPDASEILRQLQFHPNNPIQSRNIGQSLQTMRALTEGDSALMSAWTSSLQVEPRAYSVANELRLETSYSDGEDAVRETVATYHSGTSEQHRERLVNNFRRNRSLVEGLKRTYHGRCQLCGYDPVLLYGTNACDAHHVVYLSRGGRDELSNMMLLCPNHHAVIHATNAVFDYKDNHYLFPNGRREPLVLDLHFAS